MRRDVHWGILKTSNYLLGYLDILPVSNHYVMSCTGLKGKMELGCENWIGNTLEILIREEIYSGVLIDRRWKEEIILTAWWGLEVYQ